MDFRIGFTPGWLKYWHSDGKSTNSKWRCWVTLAVVCWVVLCRTDCTVHFTSQVGWKHRAWGPSLHKKPSLSCHFHHPVSSTQLQVLLLITLQLPSGWTPLDFLSNVSFFSFSCFSSLSFSLWVSFPVSHYLFFQYSGQCVLLHNYYFTPRLFVLYTLSGH